jgi:YesN/AraC family two-component response regulator
MPKKLLLVDDEKFFLEGLKEGLSEYEDVFTTDICFSVNEAIKLNERNEYDLIITDIQMPEKSGLDLFVYLREHHFKGGVIAMTAYASEDFFKKIKKLGELNVISKPFNFTRFKDRILEFFSRDEDGVSSKINSINLTSILQIINLEKKSAVVKIEIEDNGGFLYFNKGEMVHAQFKELLGEEAAIHLIKMNRGKFSILKGEKKAPQTINTPFFVLMINIMNIINKK